MEGQITPIGKRISTTFSTLDHCSWGQTGNVWMLSLTQGPQSTFALFPLVTLAREKSTISEMNKGSKELISLCQILMTYIHTVTEQLLKVAEFQIQFALWTLLKLVRTSSSGLLFRKPLVALARMSRASLDLHRAIAIGRNGEATSCLFLRFISKVCFHRISFLGHLRQRSILLTLTLARQTSQS